jgi:hypothetical protein
MIVLLAALLITEPVVSHPYTATAKPVALARTDTGAVACWTNAPQVLCAVLRPSGGFDAAVALPSLMPGASDTNPAVGWNGSELLVAYEEEGAPNSILLTPLDRNLHAITQPIRLMYATKAGAPPSLAWDGKEWLLTQRSFATRLSPALDFIQNIAGDSSVLEGAVSGGRFLYVNEPLARGTVVPCSALSYYPPPCTTTVTTNEWTAMLLPSGKVGLPLSPAPIGANATVASRVRGALLVWPLADASLIAAPLEGTRLGATHTVATAGSDIVAPRVAATENNALLVWEDANDIRGVLLHADGTADGEPFLIAATAQKERHPSALALNETEYVVVYELEGRLATRFVLIQPIRRRTR